MKVRVKLFARIRELAGTNEVEIEVEPGASVGQLREILAREYPKWSDMLRRSAIAMNAEFAKDDAAIREGAELAIIPPVSGG